MADFCEDKGIRLDLTSVGHPESNGQAERENQSILHGITPRTTGFTPFFLVYGAEAIMPTDIAYDSPRVTNYAEEENERARQDDVDLLDEARDFALARTAIYQQGLRRYHSRRVRGRSFQEGDLVLRLIQDKKGPFAVSRALGNDSYYLTDVRKDDKGEPLTREVERPWNINILCRFYT
ncbi:uncharacterized protein [Lolium perenne]|uniref:uncharacterized protein n=1 Tax=Lolium perenne TaxID=4522 RepID=UPI0021F5F87A|nr:uncharacterized protein LOC127310445 [Lolium perenne]